MTSHFYTVYLPTYPETFHVFNNRQNPKLDYKEDHNALLAFRNNYPLKSKHLDIIQHIYEVSYETNLYNFI